MGYVIGNFRFGKTAFINSSAYYNQFSSYSHAAKLTKTYRLPNVCVIFGSTKIVGFQRFVPAVRYIFFAFTWVIPITVTGESDLIKISKAKKDAASIGANFTASSSCQAFSQPEVGRQIK